MEYYIQQIVTLYPIIIDKLSHIYRSVTFLTSHHNINRISHQVTEFQLKSDVFKKDNIKIILLEPVGNVLFCGMQKLTAVKLNQPVFWPVVCAVMFV